MQELIRRIQKLISSDKIEEAIGELKGHFEDKDNDFFNLMINLQARLLKSKKNYRRGTILRKELEADETQIRFSILDAIDEFDIPKNEPNPDNNKNVNLQSVFISYNHGDEIIANQLKAKLLNKCIPVIIDSDSMKPGENIEDFINKSIKETDITVSIISNESLLSAWVSMETILNFNHATFNANKEFIACYLNDDFFQDNYRWEATQKIDARISEIDELIPAYIQEKMDTIDINSEKTRLFNLRNNLGDTLLRLKESLCLDIRENKFEDSVNKIIRMINA